MFRRSSCAIGAVVGLGLLLGSGLPVRWAEAAPCDAVPRLPVATIDAAAQSVVLEVSAPDDCDWRLDAWAPFTLPARRHWWGPRQVTIAVTANPGLTPRTALFSIGGHDVRLVQAGGPDADGDGVSDAWAQWWGLPAGGNHDPDGDGVPTLEEAHAGTHPDARAADTFWFAEGVSTRLLQTTYAFVSVAPAPVTLVVTFFGREGVLQRWPVRLQPEWPTYLDAERFTALDGREFAVAVEASAGQVVAERIVTVTGGGQQAAPATYARRAGAGTDWYLAEGTTRAGFQLFYLLANPGPQAAAIDITYYFPDGRPPLTRGRRLAPFTRDVLWVNTEAPDLGATDVAARLRSDQPIVVERTQYLQRPDGAWTAATAAAAQPAPATHWAFAEGATGPFFDTFFAFLNPSDAPATVTATFNTDGLSAPPEVLRTYTLPPRARATTRIDDDPDLVATAFGARFTTDVPVAIERMMWWPGEFPSWYEGHSSSGRTLPVSPWVRQAAPLVELRPLGVAYVLSLTKRWRGIFGVQWWTVRCEDGSSFSHTAVANEDLRETDWLQRYQPQALSARCALVVRLPSCADLPCEGELAMEVATYGDAADRFWGRGTVRWLQLIEP